MSITCAALISAGCGGDSERQDEADPSGDFPVEITAATFPNEQRLAQTSDLVIAVRNTGEEAVPELAVTIYVGDGASQPFHTRLEQPGLANPNRPVWILEHRYPKIVGEDLSLGSSVGTAAQTNTFSFGPLEPGDTREMLWKVTPVMAGTFTVNYEVAASLTGKSVAVTESGEQPKGKFVVTITDKPPKARVTGSGEVEILEPGEDIGPSGKNKDQSGGSAAPSDTGAAAG